MQDNKIGDVEEFYNSESESYQGSQTGLYHNKYQASDYKT